MYAHDTAIVQRYRPLAEMVPAHWQTSGIETENGTQIHYTRTGGAKPVVLLAHGIQVDGSMWLRTAQALEAEFDVIMPDLRGHGLSRGADGGWSSTTMVQDLIAVLRALEVDTPFVVGHSLGADLVGRLAVSKPVRAVVLVDPALRNVAAALPAQTDALPSWMLPIIQTMQVLRTQTHAERMTTGLRLLPPGTPVWHEADYVAFVDGHAHFDVATYRSLASMGYLVEAPDLIAQIAAPVLLLTARPMLPGLTIDGGVAVFDQHWRTGQHIHFGNSGHFIPFDQFERFIDVLTGFLQKH